MVNIFKDEKLEAFPLRLGPRHKCLLYHFFSTLYWKFQLMQKKTGEGNERHTDWAGRNQDHCLKMIIHLKKFPKN